MTLEGEKGTKNDSLVSGFGRKAGKKMEGGRVGGQGREGNLYIVRLMMNSLRTSCLWRSRWKPESTLHQALGYSGLGIEIDQNRKHVLQLSK